MSRKTKLCKRSSTRKINEEISASLGSPETLDLVGDPIGSYARMIELGLVQPSAMVYATREGAPAPEPAFVLPYVWKGVPTE